MLDILLMVVIGGMGTIYGAIIGAAMFILAQNYLQALMGSHPSGGRRRIADAAGAVSSRPLAVVARPAVYLQRLFFPAGIVGRLRAGRQPST